MAERAFTLEEATALLPWLEQVLGRVDDLAVEIRRSQQRAEEEARRGRGNGHAPRADAAREAREQAKAAAARIEALLREVAERGIVLRDPVRGLVDFPSRREGRTVFLCWHRGESAIGYWHEVDTGFAGRQPL